MPAYNFRVKKKILLIILSCSLFAFSGCFDFSGKLKQKRSELTAEKDHLKDEIRRNITLLDQKDRLRMELAQNRQRLNLYKESKIKMMEKKLYDSQN